MSATNEGTIVFRLQHQHKGWSTNSSGYNFDIARGEDISVATTKHPDKTLEIKITGPYDKTFTFRNPIPVCDERGLHVAITWKEGTVKLYLNGQLVETNDEADP